MNGRVVTLDAIAHRRADLLLPWFVNGTLEREEAEFVLGHLRECSICRREVQWLGELGAACAKALDDGETIQSTTTYNMGVARMRSIAATRIRRPWRRGESGTRWALVAQFLVVVALTIVLAASLELPAQYRTLGAVAPSAPDADKIATVFDTRLTEPEIRRVLRLVGAHVVEGPLQGGAYLLEVPQGKGDEALSILHSEPGVRLAVSLGPVRNR
jgi:hypothetical protein